MSNILNKGISKPVAIATIAVFILLVFGGVLGYKIWWQNRGNNLPVGLINKTVETDGFINEQTKQVTEKKICSYPIEDKVFSLSIKGENCILLLQNKNGLYYVLNNGKQSKAYIGVSVASGYNKESPKILTSFDGKHYFFIGSMNSGNQDIIFDGDNLVSYSSSASVNIINSIFSPDSQHLAYRVDYVEGDKDSVILDGKTVAEFNSIGPGIGTMEFSLDNQLIYSGEGEGGQQFFINNKMASSSLNAVIFSPDGRHRADIIVKESIEGNHGAIYPTKSVVSWDGKEGKEYTVILSRNVWSPGFNYPLSQQIVFSPDSNHFVYVADDLKDFIVVVDGKEYKRYERFDGVGHSIRIEKLQFSQNGEHFVYTIEKSDTHETVVIDGQEQQSYSNVNFSFSPDGKHLAYVANKTCTELIAQGCYKGMGIVVVDGVEGEEYDGVGYFQFSQDSSHYGYVAGHMLKKDYFENFFVIDGIVKSKEIYNEIRSFVLSPDGKHFAFIGQEGKFPEGIGNKYFVVTEDSKRVWRLDDYFPSFLGYSLDSRHFAFMVRDKNKKKDFFVIDGNARSVFDEIYDGGFSSPLKELPEFLNNSTFAYYARLNNDIYYVVEQID